MGSYGGNPHLPIVAVMVSDDRLLLAMAKGLLDEAGIVFSVAGEEISLRPGMVDALFNRPCTILVGSDSELAAREVLQQLSEDDAENEEVIDGDSSVGLPP